ncbi:MAG: hypothetical protein II221_01765, partial [Paludibacteraceae bacterium]|nr:hypothetical protein [Paludibacteraceae bacterium]
MKKGIHPESYRTVIFKDMSNGLGTDHFVHTKEDDRGTGFSIDRTAKVEHVDGVVKEVISAVGD